LQILLEQAESFEHGEPDPAAAKEIEAAQKDNATNKNNAIFNLLFIIFSFHRLSHPFMSIDGNKIIIHAAWNFRS
jgi:hypothetical protein